MANDRFPGGPRETEPIPAQIFLLGILNEGIVLGVYLDPTISSKNQYAATGLNKTWLDQTRREYITTEGFNKLLATKRANLAFGEYCLEEMLPKIFAANSYGKDKHVKLFYRLYAEVEELVKSDEWPAIAAHVVNSLSKEGFEDFESAIRYLSAKAQFREDQDEAQTIRDMLEGDPETSKHSHLILWQKPKPTPR